MITTFKGEVGKSRDCTFEFYDWCWFNNLIKKESIRLCSRENSRDFPINLGSFWFLTYSMLRHAVGLLPLSQVWPFTDRSFLGAKSEISLLPLRIAVTAAPPTTTACALAARRSVVSPPSFPPGAAMATASRIGKVQRKQKGTRVEFSTQH